MQIIAYSFIGEKLMNCVRIITLLTDYQKTDAVVLHLLFQSFDVNQTLWDLNWYEQPVLLQEMIKFIMLQAQNNKIALSASSVLNIGYESYLKYVKISFQILCLLQSFYV